MKNIILQFFILALSCIHVFSQEHPEGAVLQFSDVVLQKTPEGNQWAQARCDVATLKKGIPNNGYIEVDFIEVIQKKLDNHKIDTVAREDYNTEGKTLTISEGGLYLRNPWFIPNDEPRLLTNAIETGGNLIIKVGEQPDLISHIWTECKEIDANTQLIVRIRFRITGEIGFQFGLDYSPTEDCSLNNHTEAFYSPWYFDTKGQFITETYPDYTKLEKFGREHYGVYSNGTFFVSKPLVDHIQGKTVKLVTSEDNWQLGSMNLVDNKYQININKKLQGKIRYCFEVDGSDRKYIPHAVENDLIYWNEDAQTNGKGGFDFVTEVLNTSYMENLQHPEDLHLTHSPDSNYLYIKSPYPIKRLFVTDMAGRKSYDYFENVPEKIIIAGFNSGTYIVNIETEHGNFAKKFIK